MWPDYKLTFNFRYVPDMPMVLVFARISHGERIVWHDATIVPVYASQFAAHFRAAAKTLGWNTPRSLFAGMKD